MPAKLRWKILKKRLICYQKHRKCYKLGYLMHYDTLRMEKQGAVPTDARYNGMTGKKVCGGGKMTSGDKGLWKEEHPPTWMSQHISWPRQLAHREQKNESFRGFSFVLSSICIIFAETFWETGDTSALYINYICIYCQYVLGQKMTTGRRGWLLPLSQYVTATGRVDGIPRKSGMTGYGQYLPWPG